MTADIELLPPPKWLLEEFTDPTIEMLRDYTRANMAPLIAEIERLRAEREVIGAEAVKYADKSGRLEARAERLAEALLELCNFIDGHEVPVAVEAKAAHARDALRDHDQEGGNP